MNDYEAATLERRAYQREWRARNRARVRRYNVEYWERRAMRRNQEEKNNATSEDHGRSSKVHPGI